MNGKRRDTASRSGESIIANETIEKEDVAMADSQEKGDEMENQNDAKHEEKLCPLFMDGLPSDFSTNAGLAAIASLLNEDDEPDDDAPRKKEYEAPPTQAGGGKIRRTPVRSNRKEGRPYTTKARVQGDKKETSVGETHLFLKMWKL